MISRKENRYRRPRIFWLSAELAPNAPPPILLSLNPWIKYLYRYQSICLLFFKIDLYRSIYPYFFCYFLGVITKNVDFDSEMMLTARYTVINKGNLISFSPCWEYENWPFYYLHNHHPPHWVGLDLPLFTFKERDEVQNWKKISAGKCFQER